MNKSASLTPACLAIIRDKGTEKPALANDYLPLEPGTYVCRQCGLALFRSQDQFIIHCGWLSFAKSVSKHVHSQLDQDGIREEIVCSRCHGHLGHVFYGEGYNQENTRYCVNRLSLDFVNSQTLLDSEEAIYAGGCFWGVEYLIQHLKGVVKTEVGFIGGTEENPSYHSICQHHTGYFEAVRVLYDPTCLSYQALSQYFFEIHDPTDKSGQGPDHGPQYLSAIFYYNEKQKEIATSLIHTLRQKGYHVITQVLPITPFYAAEAYHQQYYQKNGQLPYCHHYQKKF